MKIINLIWGYSLGGGIDKCYLSYATMGDVDKDMLVRSVCIRIRGHASHMEALERLDVHYIDIQSKWDISWLGRLNGYINSERPDLVFTHGFNGAIVMFLERIIERQKVNFVCSYHGRYHAPTMLKRLFTPLYNRLPLWIYKNMARKVICVENVSRNYLISKGVPEQKVVTIHNGIPDYTFGAECGVKLRHNAINILTASRIDKVKGLTYLLKALVILQGRHVSFHYYMVGEGPELTMLETEVRELGLGDYVTFAGFQSNVPQWLASCDIFVVPSLSECHSIAILEAMRAGKAIVATRVGGNGESIEDGVSGLLVGAGKSEELTEALQRLITDSTLRETLGNNARQRFLKDFTENAMKLNLVGTLRS